MKLPSVLLVGSLALNATLVALYLGKSSPAGSHASKPSSAEAARSAALGRIWAELRSDDPAALAARLRAAGLSPETIRAIVEARDATVASGNVEGADASFSLPSDPAVIAARVRARAARPVTDAERAQYGDLTREKIRLIQQINSDYNELTREVRAKAPGTLIAEDREKIAYLEKEKSADLARLLSPQEFEEYQLRTSNTAASLRYLRDQAVGFRASEEEFRAVYRATIAAETASGALLPSSVLTASDSARKKQAMIDAQLQAALSPERYADYKRATDPAYQPVDRLVTRLDLPASTSDQVVALQKDLQQRAAAIRANAKTPVPARNEQLAALAEETAAKLTAALTPRGFDAYRQDNMSSWMRTLAPLPPPPPPKPKS